MKDDFDIVIIGAGPAGLNAGLQLMRAERRSSVLLLDTVKPWERPIPCAEAVGKLGFNEAVEVRKSWIRQEITKATFHAPDGSSITYTDRHGGYIIDRAAMQRDLADDLVRQGVRCDFNLRVRKITEPRNGIREVRLEDGTIVCARVVIDASGPLSGLGREEAIAWKPGDLEPAYFVFAEEIDIPPDTVHIYAGRDIAPGGYAWVFPRGEGGANIGLLIGKRFRGKANIRALLDAFLSRQFPSIHIVRRFAGAIPCAHARGPAYTHGLIKTGDAAGTVNPISRAGISEALYSGSLAGNAALAMLEAKSDREKMRIGAAYEKAWQKKKGARHIKLARVKQSLASVPDGDYNGAARALSSLESEEVSMARIFTAALGRFPRLVWALRYLM